MMNETIGEAVGDAPAPALNLIPAARPLPDAVRASLEAVRVAQLAARERARSEMWQARAVVATVAAVVTIGGVFVWPRLHGGRAANAAAAARAASLRQSAESAPAPIPSPASVAAPGGLLAAGVADFPAVKEAPAASDAAAQDACRDSYQGKRWRAAAAACASAFTAHPDDAKLALRVAEAEYARDHLPEARDWAQRTLALDAAQADALAILGRSEQRTGHGEAAARAFRRYLALAPHGWHAPEARAALRGDRARTRPPVAPATTTRQARPRDEEASSPAPTTEPDATTPPAFVGASAPASAP